MKYIKDPISALTHLIGLILAFFATYSLVYKSIQIGSPVHTAAFAIFGASLILLYMASTIYHTINRPQKLSDFLHRVDHMMIFVLIAGTYTPICLIPLQGTIGYSMLTLIWCVAIAGIFFKIFWMNSPRWIYTIIYVAMGWVVIFAIYPITKALEHNALYWLVGGGIAYTVGAVIYGTKWPLKRAKYFGFHEIFHIFVLLGSFCHYMLMFRYV